MSMYAFVASSPESCSSSIRIGVSTAIWTDLTDKGKKLQDAYFPETK
jgi:hypothetical protein